MGTTKLTRKEILAEDPVHEAMMQILGFFRDNGKTIGILAAVAVLLALAAFGGLQYLKGREAEAQEQLGRGMDFFHGEIAADAVEDPYGRGPTPTFQSDTAKYQAAAREFSSVISRAGYSKISIIARYYLGLTQMKLGQNKEALQNLESVAGSSRNRTVGCLAGKVLATEAFNAQNYRRAAEILEPMIKDSKCGLPIEDLSIQLSRALDAQGRRDDALRVLREASSQGTAFSALKQQVAVELDRLQKAPKTGSAPSPVQP